MDKVTATVIGTIALFGLLRYMHRSRDRSSTPTALMGNGYVLVRSSSEKSLAWLNIFMSLPVIVFSAYGGLQEGNLRLAVWGPVFGALWLILALLYLRITRRSVELTESGVKLLGDRKVVFIPWGEVSSVSLTSLSSGLIVRSLSGEEITIDKMYIGARTSGVDYLRAHLSQSLFPSGLKCDPFWRRLVDA